MSITAWWNSLSKPISKNSVKALGLGILLAPVLSMFGCGGSGGTTKTTTSPLVVSVQINPSASTVVEGHTQAFVATVQNSSNATVTWSVQEGATAGTVNSSGMYTSPMTAGTYHVVASSQADTTKSAAATVTVTAPAPVTGATSPAPLITSTPPTLANEGDLYTYTLAATDPASTVISFALVSGPDGVQISGSTLTWTPSHTQSRVPNAFEIKATTGAGGSASQDFSVTPLGTIRGTAVDTYVTALGNVTGVEDLTKVYIGASVPNGSSWQTIEGVAQSDGTFVIQRVPAGNYWFATASGGYWTSASDLDLGQDFLGRKDGILPVAPTSLGLSLSGLTPWDSADSIEIYNANLGQSFDWSDNNNPGDTSTVSLWGWTGPLSETSRGDAWYVTQLCTTEASETSAWSYVAAATPAILINQTDGSAAILSGTLANVPQVTVHLKTLGSQFAAIASEVAVNSQVHSTTFGIYSEPFSVAKGWIGYAPPLLKKDDQEPITTDVDSGELSYGNPYPTDWTPFADLEYELNVGYTASGAVGAVDVPAEIYINSTQLPSSGSPLAPVVTPVRNVKLSGTVMDRWRAVATLSPSLSWDAPVTGTPTGYRVTVYQLSKDASSSSSAYLAVLDLFTKDTNMTIPDGVLTAGNEYFFGIRSYIVPGVDFTTAPYRSGFPWAHTDMLTTVVSTTGAIPASLKVAPSAIQHIMRSALGSSAQRAGDKPGLKIAPHRAISTSVQ